MVSVLWTRMVDLEAEVSVQILGMLQGKREKHPSDRKAGSRGRRDAKGFGLSS